MFTQLCPILFVDDLSAEVRFYQALGFQIEYQSPEFVGLAFGKAILFGVQYRPGATFGPDQPVLWQIATADMDGVYRRCQEAHLPILKEPALQSWGEWTMTVLSPNGYRVVFEGAKQ